MKESKYPFGIQSNLDDIANKMRQENFKASPQLALGDIILKLEGIKNTKLPVKFDIGKYHPTGIDSWRGSYDELSLEYDDKGDPMSLLDFLKMLKSTVGKTMTGYKGGDFLMGETTPVWVANYGKVSGFRKYEFKDTAVVDVIEQESAVIIKTKAMNY